MVIALVIITSLIVGGLFGYMIGWSVGADKAIKSPPSNPR